jgi:hypothetical protein
MPCIRNRSKICSNQTLVLTFFCVAYCLSSSNLSIAAVASKFSLSTGELYTDNVFFSKTRYHDFITFFKPELVILYAPAGDAIPTSELGFGTAAQVFTRNTDLNNFGENIWIRGSHTQRFSPRVSFHFSENFERLGESRIGGFGEGLGKVGLPNTPTSQPDSGSELSDSRSQNLKDFVSRGDQITNSVYAQGSYLFDTNTSINGHYRNDFVTFIDAGGSEVFHEVGIRGVQRWRQEHNIHAGYAIKIGKSRDGERSVIHNFDVGDDFFSNLQIRLSPTLTLAASTGVSLNLGNEGPRVANNTNITVVKLWETATLAGGLRKGLTPSFGVSGISDTTSVFSDFNIRITERLSANSGLDFSRYDTDDVNFETFQAKVGLKYPISSWLSSSLEYNFRWLDRGSGPSNVTLLEKGIVRGNTVFLAFAFHFDLWPNPGVARAIISPEVSPIIRTPFSGSPSTGSQATP